MLGASSPKISTVVVSVPAAVNSQPSIEALVFISKTVATVTEKEPPAAIPSSQEASIKGGPNSESVSSKVITADLSKPIPVKAQSDLFTASGPLATQQAAGASISTSATASPPIDASLKEKGITKVPEITQNTAAQATAKTPSVPSTGPINAWMPTGQLPFLPYPTFPNQYNWPHYGGIPGLSYPVPRSFDYPSGLFDAARYPYGPLNYAYISPLIQRPSSSIAAKKLLGIDDTLMLVNQIKQQAQQAANAQQTNTPSPTSSPTPASPAASLSLDPKATVKIGGDTIAIGTNHVS